MKIMEKFEKLSIGQPDLNRVKRIVKIYRDLAELSENINMELVNIYTSEDNSPKTPLSFLFEFLTSDKPYNVIAARFAELRGIAVPGLDIEKLIATGLIAMPKEDIEIILQHHAQFKKLMKTLENEDYCMSLSKLYNPDIFSFEIPDNFETEVIADLSVFTNSELENKAVKALEDLTNAINNLIALGVLPSDSRCLNISIMLGPVLTIDKTSDRPAILSQQIFRHLKLKKFASDGKFRTSTKFDLKTLLS